MLNFFTFVKSLFQSLLIVLTRPHPPLPVVSTPMKSAPDKAAVLAQLIESRTIALGPIPGTGGVIHQVSKDQASTLAAIIVAAAAANGVRLSLLQALLDGESKDDPNAVNPNDQDAKKGETAAQALLHEDVGIEQEDVSTALGNPQFAKLTTSEVVDRLKDPDYGVGFAAKTLRTNIDRATTDFQRQPALKSRVPNGDPEVLACQAYNSGYNGALEIATFVGVKGNWKYGLGVTARAAGWAALLDV